MSLLTTAVVGWSVSPWRRIPGHDGVFVFGSLAAAFDVFSADELGVTLAGLYAMSLQADGPAFTSPLGVEFKKRTLYRKRRQNS